MSDLRNAYGVQQNIRKNYEFIKLFGVPTPKSLINSDVNHRRIVLVHGNQYIVGYRILLLQPGHLWLSKLLSCLSG